MFTLGTMAKATLGIEKEKLVPKGINVKLLLRCIYAL